jgi:hypothetical protein
MPMDVCVQGDVTVIVYHARRTLQTSAAHGVRTFKQMLDNGAAPDHQDGLSGASGAVGMSGDYWSQQQQASVQRQRQQTDVMGVEMFRFEFNTGFLDEDCDRIRLARFVEDR